MRQPIRRSGRRGGFSLMELVIAITIMTIIAGAAVPMTSRMVNSAARRATKEEVDGLARAAAEFFTDTGVLPTTIARMIVDPGTTGWTGPYLPGVTTDEISGLTTFEVDGWSRPYTITVVGDTWTCRSAGGDGTSGSADDISITLDVTYLRRMVTVERLAVVNLAILKYNAVWQGVDDLPSTSYLDVFNRLWGRSFLPNDVTYRYDGWGDEFLLSPSAPPVVAVQSGNL